MEFWTFGDSFASTAANSSDWFSLLTDKFKGEKYYNYYCDARDVQTIMDSFYRNLCNISDDSLVVIWLPSLARLRYPKKPKSFTKLLEASFTTNGKFFDINHIENVDGFDVIEYFTHFPYYNFPHGKPKPELEFPFDSFDLNKIDSNHVTYDYNDDIVKPELKRKIEENLNSIKPVDFAKLLLINEANVENWNSIFGSLNKFCNFDILFVSWTDEYNPENVVGKEQLTKEIGFWHTKHEEYQETDGEYGIEWDEHFSTKMNKSFSEWMQNKYPKYFNK